MECSGSLIISVGSKLQALITIWDKMSVNICIYAYSLPGTYMYLSGSISQARMHVNVSYCGKVMFRKLCFIS